jgi:enoyl-CoA hydratase
MRPVYRTQEGAATQLKKALPNFNDMQEIAVEKDESARVATVTLNRPERLNALDARMIAELHEAFVALEADRSIGAIVLTGAGERAFCAGADITGFREVTSALDGAAIARAGQRLTLLMEAMGTPIVAAINGFALGGGLEVAMATDVRVASERAKFGQPEINLGLMPGFGGSIRTPRLVGRGMAMYLCLSGEQIDAQEALRIGLVQRVSAHAEVLTESTRIARLIASKAPAATASIKHSIDQGLKHADIAPGLEVEALLFGALFNTRDTHEGVSAFLEKRAPKFTGS